MASILKPALLLVILVAILCVEAGPDCTKLGKKYKMVNGCTKVPNYRFTGSCNRHDICYLCGARYNHNRKSCDKRFLRSMRRVCKKLKWRKRPGCRIVAGTYYAGVRAFGKKYFKKKSQTKKICTNSWVKQCL